MWPFGRKAMITSTAAEPGWSVGESSHQGRRMIVRKYNGVPAERKQQLPVRLGVAVPLRRPDAEGMPGADELTVLARIEDLLHAELEQQEKGIHVLAITTGGMREFVFYVVEGGWAQACVDRVRADAVPYELQTYTKLDRKWTLYSEFAFTAGRR